MKKNTHTQLLTWAKHAAGLTLLKYFAFALLGAAILIYFLSNNKSSTLDFWENQTIGMISGCISFLALGYLVARQSKRLQKKALYKLLAEQQLKMETCTAEGERLESLQKKDQELVARAKKGIEDNDNEWGMIRNSLETLGALHAPSPEDIERLPILKESEGDVADAIKICNRKQAEMELKINSKLTLYEEWLESSTQERNAQLEELAGLREAVNLILEALKTLR